MSADISEPTGDPGSSMRSEQQEEAGELSLTEAARDDGEALTLEALSWSPRALARYC